MTAKRNTVVKVTTALGKSNHDHLTLMHVFCSNTLPTTGCAAGKDPGSPYLRILWVMPSAILLKVRLMLLKLVYESLDMARI